MISAFVLREFGFGMHLTPMQLDEINQERRKQAKRNYSDKDAAIIINRTTVKPTLTHSPIVHQFDYGNNQDG
jgi:hypothetical protein